MSREVPSAGSIAASSAIPARIIARAASPRVFTVVRRQSASTAAIRSDQKDGSTDTEPPRVRGSCGSRMIVSPYRRTVTASKLSPGRSPEVMLEILLAQVVRWRYTTAER